MGPADVERSHVGCCRQGPARVPTRRLRVWETGRRGAHKRIEIPQGSGRGGSLRIIPGPPLAVALATTQKGKSKRSPRVAHKAPSANALTWHGPLFPHLSTQLSGPDRSRLVPGTFPPVDPAKRRMEPQGIVGGARLPCGELEGYRPLCPSGPRQPQAGEDTVAFPPEPAE